jgi:hypothetical protein
MPVINAQKISNSSLSDNKESDNPLLSNISYSGADIVATMIVPIIGRDGKIQSNGDVIELGSLQTVSYSIHRENTPIRTIGHSNVRGFVKGARTIAGSLIFTVFNEYAFYQIQQYRNYLSDQKGFFAPLADMLPPFDLVFTFFNEYGVSSKMKIFGVTIVDEGQTMSIDDLITEQTYSYMARGIQPMVHVVGDKEKITATEEFQRIVDQTNKNIFGDNTQGQVSTLYNNFVEDVYGA